MQQQKATNMRVIFSLCGNDATTLIAATKQQGQTMAGRWTWVLLFHALASLSIQTFGLYFGTNLSGIIRIRQIASVHAKISLRIGIKTRGIARTRRVIWGVDSPFPLLKSDEIVRNLQWIWLSIMGRNLNFYLWWDLDQN